MRPLTPLKGTIMSKQQTATILVLNPTTKVFLKKLGFPDIPDDANYCAFYDDGQAEFIEDIEFKGFAIPRLAALTYYDAAPITIEQ